MSLAPGTLLGPYEILAPLGAGGMGEVYRARDPRLGREVAVKVVPDELAGAPDRLRRFEQEARSASTLNHPKGSGSSPSSPTSRAHGIDGVGAGFVVPLWRPDAADRIERVSTHEAIDMARRLAREEGPVVDTTPEA